MIMSDLQEILKLVPTDQLAQALGVDEQSAEAALRAAVPSLLAGMQSNAASPEGAESLAGALANHSNDLVDGSVNIDQVDTQDGSKIVSHVLGDREELLANQLSGANTAAGIDLGSLVRKALPILAPIVLSYLAKKWSERGGATGSGQAAAPEATQGGGLGDLLGGLLGGVLGGTAGGSTGGTTTQSGSASANPLDDLLGGLLGGSQTGTPSQTNVTAEETDQQGGYFGDQPNVSSNDPLAGARGKTGASQPASTQSTQGGIDLGSILGGLFGGR
ncbi:hypothetical protein GCM10009861_15520 [Neomicrococcus aestuarii]